MAEPSASLDVSAPRPCLRGHHQRRRGPSSTRTPSGDARSRPQRSRHAATAGLAAPLVGLADIATAAPSPSLLRGAPSCGAPRPLRPPPASSRSVLDPNGQRRRSGPATALASCGDCRSCGALGRPSWHRHGRAFALAPAVASGLRDRFQRRREGATQRDKHFECESENKTKVM